MPGLNDEIDNSDNPELNGANAGEVQPRDFSTPNASVAASNPAQPAAQPTSFLARYGEDNTPTEEDDEPTIEDIFGPDIVPNEIPNLDMKVVLMTEKQNTINDGESVAKNIVTQNSIAQEDMIAANAVLPGILNDEHQVGFYTEQPSRVGYGDALSRIKTKLDEARDMQIAVSQEALDGMLNACKTTLQYIDDSFSSKYEMRARYAQSVKENLQTVLTEPSSNSLYNTLLSFFTCNISDLTGPVINPKINQAIEELLTNIRSSRSYSVYLYSEAYKNHFVSVDALNTVFTSQLVIDYSLPVSINDLIDTIALERPRSYLCEALRDTVKEVQCQLENRREFVSSNGDTGKTEVIQKRQALLSKSCEVLKRVLDFTSGLNRVENTLLSKVLPEIFQTLNSVAHQPNPSQDIVI